MTTTTTLACIQSIYHFRSYKGRSPIANEMISFGNSRMTIVFCFSHFLWRESYDESEFLLHNPVLTLGIGEVMASFMCNLHFVERRAQVIRKEIHVFWGW